MSNQWQARRGTTAQNDAFTGASGEITYDTDSQGLRIHDGTKQGGYLVDTVVDFQKPTAENNYTWYRLYASGFVEQGGYVTGGGAANSVSLPITMSNANYHIELTGFLHSGTAGNTTSVSDDSGAITTTGFKVNNYVENGSNHTNGVGFWWEVKGIAAN